MQGCSDAPERITTGKRYGRKWSSGRPFSEVAITSCGDVTDADGRTAREHDDPVDGPDETDVPPPMSSSSSLPPSSS